MITHPVFHRFRPAARTCLFATVLLTGILGSAATEVRAETAPPRTLTLTATGEASAVPDMAVLSAGVISTGQSATEALQQNTRTMHAVFDAMASMGIADKDVQTANFSLTPRYERYESRDGRPPQIIGYHVTNAVSVTVRELDDLGIILDRLVTVGANAINDVSFAVSDLQALERAARIDAVAKARAKAALYAETAGVTLGPVLTIQESGVSRPGPVFARMASFAEDAAVPIAKGESTVRVTITMTFALE